MKKIIVTFVLCLGFCLPALSGVKIQKVEPAFWFGYKGVWILEFGKVN